MLGTVLNPGADEDFELVAPNTRYDTVASNYGSGDSTTLGGYNNIGSYGTFNHASGYGTMANAINVTQSLAIGPQALFTAGVNPIQQTLAIGGGALFSLDLPGNENVAIGWESQNANTGDVGGGFEGNYNVSLGVQTLLNLDGGYRNTAIGHNAGGALTTGYGNTLLGFEVGLSGGALLSTGFDNILIGQETDTNGSENIIIGNSGLASGAGVSDGNLLIGTTTGTDASNNTAIGHNSTILQGGGDVLLGLSSTIDCSAFPGFSGLNTHVGGGSTITGFYNQSLGYSTDITGDDNCSLGNFHNITGEDNIAIGNSNEITADGAYLIGTGDPVGVPATNNTNSSLLVSWWDGASQYDSIFLVSDANAGNVTSNITLSGDLEIQPGGPDPLVIVEGNFEVQGQLSEQYGDNGVSAVNISPDWENGNVQKYAISAAISIDAPVVASTKVGTYVLILENSGGTGSIAAWNAVFKWPGGTAPTLSAGAGEIDVITLVCDGTNYYGTFVERMS